MNVMAESLNPLFKVGAVKQDKAYIEEAPNGLNPLFKVGAVKPIELEANGQVLVSQSPFQSRGGQTLPW